MTVTATDEAEGAQAIFCYIADFLGAYQTKRQFAPYLLPKNNPKSKDATEFFKEYNDIIKGGYDQREIDTTKTRPKIIDYITKDRGWFISSLLIAEKIIDEIEKIDNDFAKIKRPGWQNLFYQHGDDDIMNTLAELFKSANAQSAKDLNTNGKFFGDINKWTPADIYFASNKAKRTLKNLLDEPQTKNDNLTFAVLNKNVRLLLQSGDLLPLSLKKVKDHVIVEKVNFSRASENRLLAETECLGVQNWQLMTGEFKVGPRSFKWTKAYSGGREIGIKIKSGKKFGVITLRATPAVHGKPNTGVKVILKYTGASALGGQVASIPLFIKLLDTVDTIFSGEFQRVWNSGMKEFVRVADKYMEYGDGKELYVRGKQQDAIGKKAKDQFNNDMGAISGLTVMNDIRPVMDRYFSQKKEVQDNVCRAIFQYVSSRTINSARFVIAKD